MALAKHFAGRSVGSPTASNVLEAYLDFVCPFSKRLFERVFNEVLPAAEKAHPGKLRFIFRHQIQPWHPQSAIVHEASVAVAQVDPSKFLAYAAILFAKQTQFFDLQIYDKTREQLYAELADLAAECGVDRSLVLAQLARIPSTEFSNTGNKTTDELKTHIKLTRQNGIHVSPTCLWNGLVENSISSGWTGEQWAEFFNQKLG